MKSWNVGRAEVLGRGFVDVFDGFLTQHYYDKISLVLYTYLYLGIINARIIMSVIESDEIL